MGTAMTMTRRSVLRLSLGIGGMALAAGAVGLLWVRRRFDPRTPAGEWFPETAAPPGRLAPTPACEDGDEPTEATAEGPYYVPDTPERMVVREPGVVGTPLVLTGRVLSTDCRPLAGVVLDFWNCDDNGNYDTRGFKLRGHQFTDEKGTYRLETVRPADYEDGGIRRAPHIHVKVQGRGMRLLTTQIFLPGEPLNTRDRFFREALTMELGSSGDGSLHGRFDFVLA